MILVLVVPGRNIRNATERDTSSMIKFITGNNGKFKEVQTILPNVEQLDIDLPEIQEIDAREIIRTKLNAAFEHAEGEFIVEDTSLYLDCLHGLPGPLIKWFLKTIGNEGLVELSEKFGNDIAVAKTIIGYAKDRNEIHFFEGSINGKIVKSEGGSGFGWDPIFLPDGQSKTFAQMSGSEKSLLSMRTTAARKLKDFLSSL